MASALWWGSRPALLATALSWASLFAAAHFFAASFGIPPVNLRAEVVRLIIFVGVAVGISLMGGARRRAELREKWARRQAEAASLAKDEFLATVSHELRNPLAAILSWASLLHTSEAEPQLQERGLEAIERNARAQARLVDDLLDVARIVTGKFHLEVRPTSLVSVVEAALESVDAAARARGISLETVLDPAAGSVKGDAVRLQQVAWNLISNAVKFTPEGGRVSVVLERREVHALLRVADSGRGFPPELAPRLFERFWQAEPSTRRGGGGLGLGLAIVRSLVELHGGTVTAQSAGVGQGACFEVTLPLVEAAKPAPMLAAAEHASP